MTEQTVNIPLLRKAVEWAEAEAAKPFEVREWEQSWFRQDPAEVDPEVVWTEGERLELKKTPACGTCFCIAGWITAQTLTDDLHFGAGGFMLCDSNGDFVTDAQAFASLQLGLSREDECLFDGGNDIADVRRIAESIAGERL